MFQQPHFMPVQQFFDPLRFGLEFAYAIIITAMFLYIYVKTKHLFELTSYKGIQYFRIAFLFFALAYLSRLAFYIIRTIISNTNIHFPGRELSFISLILVTYLSTIAIGYLIYSNIWKKVSHTTFLVLIHILASLSLTLFFLQSPLILFFLIQAGLAVSLLLINAKKQLRVIYPLMSLFWFMNIIMLFSRRFLGFEVKILLQVLSIGLLAYIIYRISRWTK